jgi:uncharacterized protein (TIGR00730 family)
MTKIFKNIAVFCGSNTGNDPSYQDAIDLLAEAFVVRDIGLVYGGATVGIMGMIANAMLKRDGRVIGVIPQKIVDFEIAHQQLTELRIVNSMHERKAMMAELSDGFIMLPGGTGSLDEFFEVFTWAQLHYHDKPCGILNINHYFDYLLKFMDVMLQKKFIHAENHSMIIVDASVDKLLQKFVAYQPSRLAKLMR